MSPSTHTRRTEFDRPRKTFYRPDDGASDAGLLEGGSGIIHAQRDDAPAKRRAYVSVRTKFSIAAIAATLWAAASFYLAQDWLRDLSGHVGLALAALAIFGVAIIPGFMNAFLLAS